ncbi:MAG TPA: hypothetical protein VGJ26_04170 [Pirellulales bacterium]|jgi:hypothetical protein
MPKSLDYLLMLGAIALAAICWGVYGPVLHKGSTALGNSRFRAFLCVGMAYFVIAVVVPLVYLYLRGEPGTWNFKGIFWSSFGGAAGAIGALGVIMAFNFGGEPHTVMPLVFGCAPVVNAFLSIYMRGQWKEVNPMFLAGLIIVAVGAITVLLTAPRPKGGHGPTPGEPKSAAVAEHGAAGH